MALKITKEEENIMPQEETVKEMSFDVSDVNKMNIKIDEVDAPVESVTTVENIEYEEEEQNDVNSSHYSEESVHLEEDLTYEESPRIQMSLHEEKAKGVNICNGGKVSIINIHKILFIFWRITIHHKFIMKIFYI